MFSLRDIAAHQLPEGTATHEVVAKDIIRHTRKEIHAIDAQIQQEDKKYNKIFKHYTNILSPTCPMGKQYSKKWGEETLYDILQHLTVNYKAAYNNLPIKFDENSEWFEYLEYMNFRAFPNTCYWVYEPEQAQCDNLVMILITKGILKIIDETPVPAGTVPPDLAIMESILSTYVKHLKDFIIFTDKRYSHQRVFDLHKKYVAVYEHRTLINTALSKAKSFYTKIKTNMYSSVYVPSILR